MGTGSSVLLPVIVADPAHFCDMCGIEMDWGSEDETKCGYSYSYGWQEKTYARRGMTEDDASTRLHRFVIGSDGRCRTCGKAECRHFGAPRYCYRFTDRTYRESCCNCTLEKGRIGMSAYVSIRQHSKKTAYVSRRQHTSAHVSTRQHTSAYVSIRRAWSRRQRVRPDGRYDCFTTALQLLYDLLLLYYCRRR
jgi:hypothetical protein